MGKRQADFLMGERRLLGIVKTRIERVQNCLFETELVESHESLFDDALLDLEAALTVLGGVMENMANEAAAEIQQGKDWLANNKPRARRVESKVQIPSPRS